MNDLPLFLSAQNQIYQEALEEIANWGSLDALGGPNPNKWLIRAMHTDLIKRAVNALEQADQLFNMERQNENQSEPPV